MGQAFGRKRRAQARRREAEQSARIGDLARERAKLASTSLQQSKEIAANKRQIAKLEQLFSELEGRLRSAVGPETALAVTPAIRAVSHYFTPGMPPLRYARAPREAIPDDLPADLEMVPYVTETLTSLVMEVEVNFREYTQLVRMFDVSYPRDPDKINLAYSITDRALAELGPSSLDIEALIGEVMRQLMGAVVKRARTKRG